MATRHSGIDLAHVRAALSLARRGLGQTWPNPSVGCVLVCEGKVVGRGFTAPGGRPHAETVALARAGDAARGATAYVTLEPCSHHGQTPPCAEALIEAGIARVVASIEDPDPRVSGKGFARLREAGIEVEVGVGAEIAAEINAGFFLRQRSGRPLVTLKLATSLDGKVATASGESQWITGESARAAGHLMRAESDAILVGARTAVLDNPQLTCRLPGLEGRSPVRVVADGRLILDLASRLVSTARQVPTWVLTLTDADSARVSAMRGAGVEVIAVGKDAHGEVDLAAGLEALGKRGITRVLAEGGGRLTAALLRDRLVDRIAWFRAPMVLGGDGVPASVGFGIEKLEQAPRFRRLALAGIGPDQVEYLTAD